MCIRDRIPGTPFHASAKIACTLPFDAKTKECGAFVIRRGFDGAATVAVRWGEGLKRRILFVRNEVVAADSTEATVFERRSDFTIVRLGGDERFEIPEAVSYTHLTLPTSDLGEISVVAVTLKKKKQTQHK